MGSFRSGRFRFFVKWWDTSVDSDDGFKEELDDETFDLRLSRSKLLPNLGGAPVASWLLARLAKLTDNQLGIASVEHVDGGGYVVGFVVARVPVPPSGENARYFQQSLFEPGEVFVADEVGSPIASFELQADMEGAAILGQRTSEFDTEDILASFAAALLAAPNDLTVREIEVKDPEWKLDPAMYHPRPHKGSQNWYGWDGIQFLGVENIREKKCN